MLFSGLAQAYRCPSCEVNYSTTLPTSIVPLLASFVAASALWTGALGSLIGEHWSAYALSPVLALASLPLAYLVAQRLTAPWATKYRCPQCGAGLEHVGGGFVDGGPPSKQELVIYSLVTGLPGALWLALLGVMSR